MSNSVVVGVDGSEGSASTLQWSIELAQRLGLPVSAVFGYSPWAATFFGVPPSDSDDVRKLLRGQFEQQWCAPLPRAGIPHRTRFLLAEAPDALLQAAEEDAALLIALGAHGHSRWSPHMLGSVTTKVIHHSRRPIAVVPDPAPMLPAAPRLLIGVDGSAASRRALTWTARQAAALGGSARAACVVPSELWREQPAFEDSGGAPIARVVDGLGTLAADASEAAGVAVDTVVLGGDPAETLLSLSAEWDMLVLGSRGHSSLGEAVFGSVGRVCATRATRPVVIVPYPGAGS